MKTKKELRAEAISYGYFFHPGGNFHGEINCPKTRGIWKKINGQNFFIARSWAEAMEYHWENHGAW